MLNDDATSEFILFKKKKKQWWKSVVPITSANVLNAPDKKSPPLPVHPRKLDETLVASSPPFILDFSNES